ncbi:hypothetical protein DFH29DRAFT_871066 [Suillus ampliporus]|nr:hypothetical protein DFH29DRAFT_871066 [Suillus ampliporus]
MAAVEVSIQLDNRASAPTVSRSATAYHPAPLPAQRSSLRIHRSPPKPATPPSHLSTPNLNNASYCFLQLPTPNCNPRNFLLPLTALRPTGAKILKDRLLRVNIVHSRPITSRSKGLQIVCTGRYTALIHLTLLVVCGGKMFYIRSSSTSDSSEEVWMARCNLIVSLISEQTRRNLQRQSAWDIPDARAQQLTGSDPKNKVYDFL